ncbi:Acetyltransferase (isoleucine patch superfamily) [Roseovarius nanhaiticus]|uniref:Acetyltransferase (Isoleucine patch superfamily) n=1 Tax=Roseovarius nanhaiticus TaxID=573024 RepID=A0A1N7EPF9_9RHOB|nr:acyltransferase [Roseovarius nanhaiticus]SEK70043.1 Acetyltransferase (isoleucine patch superfamily) [Roseovarius nanhaiticus]SIR89944.1 Acetyltransferase (isoleucine patch superfamily) [Roseovarius nanhaiticus]
MKVFYNIISVLVRAMRYFERKALIKSAISSGMSVGRGTKFVGTQRFGSEPYLIEIGEDCLITNDVSFICHDGAWAVACGLDGVKLSESYRKHGVFGRISVGNNCFVGVNAVLLPNTKIGKNSIVGAAAVVKGDYPEGSIIAGNPARVVGKTSDYRVKKLSEALTLNQDIRAEERKRLIKNHTRSTE